jgi:hypothetical protein
MSFQEFWPIVTIILGSGAASVVLQRVFEGFRDTKKRKEATKYLALRLAFLFEGYAIDCASKISDHQMYTDSHGAAGGTMAKIPEPPGLPESSSYEFLKSEMLNRVFAFPQTCKIAQDTVTFVAEVHDEDEFWRAVEEETIKIVSEAIDIGRELRRNHGLIERQLERPRLSRIKGAKRR